MRGAISHQGLSSIPDKSPCNISHCKIQAVPFCIHTGKIWGFEAPGPVEVTHLPDAEWRRAACLVHTMCLSAVSILLARKSLPLPRKGFICSWDRSTCGGRPQSHGRKPGWIQGFYICSERKGAPFSHPTLSLKQIGSFSPPFIKSFMARYYRETNNGSRHNEYKGRHKTIMILKRSSGWLLSALLSLLC